jgi:hypothetical protein
MLTATELKTALRLYAGYKTGTSAYVAIAARHGLDVGRLNAYLHPIYHGRLAARRLARAARG